MLLLNMNLPNSVSSCAFLVCFVVLITTTGSSRSTSYIQHQSVNKDSFKHNHRCCVSAPRFCNLTNALETTYYAQFNYTGPIVEGLSCYTVYKCDGNFQSKSQTCDAFVYYLLYMETYELSVRAMYNSNNTQPDPIWTPDSGIFNYKELVFCRNGTVTIRQRQRTKLFADITENQLVPTDYATLNRKYPRDELKEWSTDFYLYNGTEYDYNGDEFTEREQCLKVNDTWYCDSEDHPNQTIVESIPWHAQYFDSLSGYFRIQFFLDNKNINRTSYHGMDGDGWNVTDTVITGKMVGPHWQNEAVNRLLFFDKLWVDGCRCANKLRPCENMTTKCEHWNLMKRNFKITFKPASLKYCPNMEDLHIPVDAFEDVS